jgi:arabinofuranan 3-O-arabinosyltransferase
MAGILFAVGLAVVAAQFLTAWGKLVTDTSHQVYLAPGRSLFQALFAWSPDPFLGQPNFDTGVAPLSAVILILRSLGIAAWAAVRLWRSALFIVGAWGALRLFDRFMPDAHPAGRWAAAALYAFNPYAIVGAASQPILLPYALFPWLLLSFGSALESPGGWRRPALVALVFFLMGGLNAGIVPMFLILGLVAYLVYAVWFEGVRLRSGLWTLAKCLGLMVLVSLYWIVPALVSRGVTTKITATTETPQITASASSYQETLRLLGNWPLYGRRGPHPFLPGWVAYLTNPGVVLATFAFPFLAAVSAWRVRTKIRALSLMLLVITVPVIVGLFPPDSPTALGRAMDWLYRRVPGAVGFRTTYKLGIIAALAIVLLLAAGASSLATWVTTRRASGGRLRWLAAAAALLAVVVAVFPLWTGKLFQKPWALPAYWQRAADRIQAGPSTTRILMLPGEASASYRWGKRGVLDLSTSLTSRSSVYRTVVPNGSTYAANFLAGFDAPLNLDALPPGTLPSVLRYLGVQDVLLRNDMLWEQFGGERPAVIASELRDSGLVPIASFGLPGQNVLSAQPGRLEFNRSLRTVEAELPPLELLRVPRARPFVRPESAAGAVLLDGDNSAIPTMAQVGILRVFRPIRLLGTMTTSELRGAIRDGAVVVLTDTNRRRVWNFRRTGLDYSGTLAATQGGRSLETLALFPDNPSAESVTQLTGAAAVTARGSVAGVAGNPFRAFDGDPKTAWLARASAGHPGGVISIQLSGRRTIAGITLAPEATSGLQVRKASVVFAPGVTEEISFSTSAAQSITLPTPVLTSRIAIKVDQVGGSGFGQAGFSEVSIPGLRVDQSIRLPTTFTDLAGPLVSKNYPLLQRPAMHVLLQRAQNNPTTPTDDEDASLVRSFELPVTRVFTTVVGRGNLASDAPDYLFDHLTGFDKHIKASSSARVSPANRASAALDGNPNTSWIPPAPGLRQWIQVSFPAQSINHIVIHQDPLPGDEAASEITGVTVSLNGGPPESADVEAPESTIHFPRQSVSSVKITIVHVVGLNAAVHISDLDIGSISLPVARPTSRLRGCVRGVDLDGSPVSLRFVGTLRQLGTNQELVIRGCHGGDVVLAGHEHELRSLPGWRVDVLDLFSPGATPILPVPSPTADILTLTPTHLRLSVGAAQGPYYLVTGQGYDPRWRGSMDGKTLGPPIVVDGYSVGWLISDPGQHLFDIRFVPQGRVLASFIVSLGALILVGILLWGGRRWRASPATVPDGEEGDGRAGAGVSRPAEAALHGPAAALAVPTEEAPAQPSFLALALLVVLLALVGGFPGLFLGLILATFLWTRPAETEPLFVGAVVLFAIVPLTVLIYGLPTAATVSPVFARGNLSGNLAAGAGLALLALGVFRAEPRVRTVLEPVTFRPPRVRRPSALVMALVGIGVGAFVLRFLASSGASVDPITARIGESLVDGRGFSLLSSGGISTPTALRMPLAPLAYALAGMSATPVLLARVLWSLFGAVAAVAVTLAGRRMLSATAGLVAGVLVAASPAFFFQTARLGSDTIGTAAFALLLLAMAPLPGQRTSLPRAAGAGAAAGLLALSRPEGILLGGILLGFWLVGLARRDRDRRQPIVLVSLLAFGLLFGPWLARNAVRIHQALPTSEGGRVAVGANGPTTYGNGLIGSWDPRQAADAEAAIRSTGRLGEATLDTRLLTEGRAFATSHLSRTPIVAAVRILRTWDLWTPTGERAAHAARGMQVRGWILAWLAFIPMLFLAAAGLWLRRRELRGDLAPLALAPIVVSLVALATYGEPLMRGVIDPTVALAAAIPLGMMVDRIRRRVPARDGDPARPAGTTAAVATPLRATASRRGRSRRGIGWRRWLRR